MMERFTERARKVMALAGQEAKRLNHEYIGTEHILLGLIKEGSGVGANVLKSLGVDLQKVCLEVEKLVKPGSDMVTMGKLANTPRAKKVIEYAIDEARHVNHHYVGTEHLLLGLLRDPDTPAAQALMGLGLKLEDLRGEVLRLLGADAGPEKAAAQVETSPMGDRVEKVLAFAREEVAKTGGDILQPEHLLLGLLRENPDHAVQILQVVAKSFDDARNEVRKLLKKDTG